MDLDALILQLLDAAPITDQGDLQVRLKAQGHELTQSTLSRRLKRLGVQKVQGRYRRLESNDQALPRISIIPAPPNLLVLRTAPGFAQALGLVLDGDPAPGQLGTLAGDDTVFIAVEVGQFEAARRHVQAVAEGR